MEIDEFIKYIYKLPRREYKKDDYQEQIIRHGKGPMWVLAGPGSGKTDSMALRCLKLLIVDRAEPRSIIVTTFTEKAAINLKNRITDYMEDFRKIDPALSDIDYTALRIGTLHGLCSDIMHEFRFKEFQNFRVLDDLEQLLFILEHSTLTRAYTKKQPITSEEDSFWKKFSYLASWNAAVGYGPSKNGDTQLSNIHRAEIAQKLFNRIVEDRIDLERLERAGSSWKFLSRMYSEYKEKMYSYHRCDFAHLQLKFIDFLKSQQSPMFKDGDGSKEFPGIDYVLVDEYQDTNPIQEEIYLGLSERNSHSICVVGDDDQALYRFRGGTVECMIEFPEVISKRWGIHHIEPFFLPKNYRSHEKIVNFCDNYIHSFPTMNKKGMRATDKLPLEFASSVSGDYDAVGMHTGKTIEEAANNLALLVKELKDNSIIEDYSECTILLKSTKESKRNALPFVEALRAQKIPYYNPRSKSLLDQEEVKVLLGVFVRIVDPELKALISLGFYKGVVEKVKSWVIVADEYLTGTKLVTELNDHVRKSLAAIRVLAENTRLTVNILDIVYHILALPPFSEWVKEQERAIHIAVITQIFDAYLSVPSAYVPRPEYGPLMLGNLFTSREKKGGISFNWRRRFYERLVSILSSKGIDDPDDVDEDFPKGKLPIMTIHQAKGLEFPFVFVESLGAKPSKKDSNLLLESQIRPYSKREFKTLEIAPIEKALQDIVRLFYVAYSRAENALVLFSSNSEVRSSTLGVGFGGSGLVWLMDNIEKV